jgi:predicted site-specific integrase-resolvase
MKLYSVTEAAVRLGIDPSLVRVYCRDGRLKARQTSGGWVITEAALRGFESKERKRGRPRTR